jgi:hypothetical protein
MDNHQRRNCYYSVIGRNSMSAREAFAVALLEYGI